MRATRKDRGQSLVELSLALLVFVPILIFGIYFAETSVLMMESTEAATEPLWDSTASLMHSYDSAAFFPERGVAEATGNAQARMRPLSNVFATSRAPVLTCQGGGVGLSYTVPFASAFYQDKGGMSCLARVDLAQRWLPRSFVEGENGWFRESLANAARPFTICSTQDCQPFAMITDDWGLTHNGTEGLESDAYGKQNQGFFGAGQTLYEANGGGAGTAYSQFVDSLVGSRPANFDALVKFQMSFKGEESGFQQNLSVSEGRPRWATTPWNGPAQASYGARSPCYLGLGCTVGP
jgi:hypothetical protein